MRKMIVMLAQKQADQKSDTTATSFLMTKDVLAASSELRSTKDALNAALDSLTDANVSKSAVQDLTSSLLASASSLLKQVDVWKSDWNSKVLQLPSLDDNDAFE